MLARLLTAVQARHTRTTDDDEGGFTLIELLVVMIIIGILAAIAVPTFLSQRSKATDTAAKADVSTLGREVETYYVDNTTAPTLAVNTTTKRYTLNSVDVGRQSASMSTPTLGGGKADWCVTLPYTNGSKTNVFYSAAVGLSTNSCTAV